MLNARSIQGIVVIVLGIILSLWLGMALVTNQIETLIKAAVVGMLLICLFLGNRIWILVPVMGAFGVGIIRGFSTVELGQALFITFALLLFLMRKLSARWSWGEMDWWALLLAVIIIQVYARNPVGLNMFGAGAVGGKPYFIIALAFMTMVFLGNMKINPKDLKPVMWLTVLAGIMGGPARALRGEFGPTATDPTEDMANPGGSTRKAVLIPPAVTAAKVLSCYISPLRAAFHPIWGIVILFSLAAASMSGYRNAVATVGLIYLAGIAYHGGRNAMILSAFLGAIALALLAVVNLLYPLPPNIQRALSPFPGTWEERHVSQAEGSTEWRVEMWKEALLTEHWIENKWLGDGLGMSAIELERSKSMQESAGRHNLSGLSVHQENAMIDGNYHSGPVQTIRTVGYVGLAVLLLGMIRLAVSAHRLILRCKGSEWFPVALFFGIPMVIEPFFFTLIFGDFGRGAVNLFIGIAMIKLLHHNLPVPAYVVKRRYAHVPLGVRNRQQTA